MCFKNRLAMTPSGWRQEKLPLCQKSISWNDKLIHHILRTDCQTHYLLSFPQFKVPKSNYFISLFTINFPRKGKGNTYVKSQYGASRSQYLVLNTDYVLCLYYNTDGQLNNDRQRQTDRQTDTQVPDSLEERFLLKTSLASGQI